MYPVYIVSEGSFYFNLVVGISVPGRVDGTNGSSAAIFSSLLSKVQYLYKRILYICVGRVRLYVL